MRVFFCWLLMCSAALAWASDKEAVTYIDPVEWDKWQWRADRAEKQLTRGEWAKADKAARNLARDVIAARPRWCRGRRSRTAWSRPRCGDARGGGATEGDAQG